MLTLNSKTRSSNFISKIIVEFIRKRPIWLLVIGLFLGVLNEAQTQENKNWPLWRSLEQGKYSVGFKIINANTESVDGKSRVVRIAMWYPSPSSDEIDIVKFKDYLNIQPDVIPDPSFEEWMNQRDRESLSKQFFGSGSESRQAALMNAPVPIQINAPTADGTFPLIVHSLGRNGNQFQHTILWEYLASHGYVVVSIGQYGKNLKDPTMAFKFKDLSHQLRDMQQSIMWLSQFSFIDPQKVGILGHSSGAIVGLWLASQDKRVNAVIGLDGSMNREENQKVFHQGISQENLEVPILNICRWPHDEYFGKWTGQLQGEITRIGFERAIHFDFQNWPAFQVFAGGQEPSSLTFRTLEEAETVFVSTAKITKLFLDAHIKLIASANLAIQNPELIKELSNGQASLTLYTVLEH